MATYQEIWNLRHESASLRNRTAVAIAKAAQDVLAENPATENHVNRVYWAQAALIDPEGAAKRMLWGVLGNSTIQMNGDSSSDSDIQNVVKELINIFATGA